MVVSSSPNNRPVVQLSRVSKSFGDVKAVDDISFEIRRGEFFSILGPSGCWVMVNKKRPYERKIAMVFQNYALFPHLSVARNVSFGLEQRKTPKGENRGPGPPGPGDGCGSNRMSFPAGCRASFRH